MFEVANLFLFVYRWLQDIKKYWAYDVFTQVYFVVAKELKEVSSMTSLEQHELSVLDVVHSV